MLTGRDFDEKRSYRRMGLDDSPVRYTVHGDGGSGEGVCRDLSGSGLLMILDRELAPGTLLDIRVAPEQSVVPPLEAEVEVVRCSPADDGSYKVGVLIRTLGAPQA